MTRLAARRAQASEQPGFAPRAAFVELVWGLSSSCGLNRHQLVEAPGLLLRSKELVVGRQPAEVRGSRTGDPPTMR